MMGSAHAPSASEAEPYSIFTPRHRKILTVLLGLASFASPLTANIYLPLLPLLQDQYHATAQAINLTITLYVVVQAVIPIFFAPTADQYGRRLVSLASLLVYTVGSIGLAINDAAGRRYPALLLLRALQAFGSSACATTIWGVTSDVCIPIERGAMIGPVLSISNLGVVLGPVVGGLVGWRTGHATWIFASMAIFSAATVVSVTPQDHALERHGRHPVAGLGWAVRYRAHPAVVLVLQAFAGFVKSLLFTFSNTLLIDVHPDRPSTAAAAASLTRSGLSGVGLAILQPLADSKGWAGLFTLLALLVGVSQGVVHLESPLISSIPPLQSHKIQTTFAQ
ncbi:uncharacterized protein PG998_010271 [Apiospora kogelbergensis]|uniref:uncharacterized protein n=1 Tax=Apiospora kogelbergensis TaxID=1337665 RepID=UPI00312E4265